MEQKSDLDTQKDLRDSKSRRKMKLIFSAAKQPKTIKSLRNHGHRRGEIHNQILKAKENGHIKNRKWNWSSQPPNRPKKKRSEASEITIAIIAEIKANKKTNQVLHRWKKRRDLRENSREGKKREKVWLLLLLNDESGRRGGRGWAEAGDGEVRGRGVRCRWRRRVCHVPPRRWRHPLLFVFLVLVLVDVVVVYLTPEDFTHSLSLYLSRRCGYGGFSLSLVGSCVWVVGWDDPDQTLFHSIPPKRRWIFIFIPTNQI